MCFLVLLKAIQQIFSLTQRPKKNKYQLLINREPVKMDPSVDELTTFLPNDMLVAWQQTITALDRMYDTVERDPLTRADFHGNSLWSFDLVKMFLTVFKKTKSWNELPFFQALSDEDKITANTQAAFLVDVIIEVLRCPPLPALHELWTRLSTAVDRFANNLIDVDEVEGSINTAMNQYARAVMLRIDNRIDARPGILDGSDGVEDVFDTLDWYYGRYTMDYTPDEAVEDERVSRLIHDLQLRLLNLYRKGGKWNEINFRINFGNVTNACFRKYSKFAIPIPFLPTPIDVRYLIGDSPRNLHGDKINQFKQQVQDISNAVSTEMAGVREKLSDDGFFAHFSNYDNTKPFGSGNLTGASPNDRVRPPNNTWRENMAHRQPVGNDGEPIPIHPDPARRPVPQPQPQQQQPQQPQPQPQQQQQAGGAPPPIVDDGTLPTYVQGGNGSLKMRARHFIAMVQGLDQADMRFDHETRFGTQQMQPVRVLRRNVRPTDMRINDGQTVIDPLYVVTFTRGARRPIFNPVV